LFAATQFIWLVNIAGLELTSPCVSGSIGMRNLPPNASRQVIKRKRSAVFFKGWQGFVVFECREALD
jgi:hypothetical protein